jgi:hypothetical protein
LIPLDAVKTLTHWLATLTEGVAALVKVIADDAGASQWPAMTVSASSDLVWLAGRR